MVTRFTVREFIYDESAILKQKQEFEDLKKSERDLWVLLFTSFLGST